MTPIVIINNCDNCSSALPPGFQNKIDNIVGIHLVGIHNPHTELGVNKHTLLEMDRVECWHGEPGVMALPSTCCIHL